MTIGTFKSPNPRYRNSISVIKSKFLSERVGRARGRPTRSRARPNSPFPFPFQRRPRRLVSSMNTLLAILKATDARRDVILAGGLYHRFPWRHLPPPPPCHKSNHANE